MAKPFFPIKLSCLRRYYKCLCIAGVTALLVFYGIGSLTVPLQAKLSSLSSISNNTKPCTQFSPTGDQNRDPINKTFYDEHETSYTLDKPMIGWDKKRMDWLKHHPRFLSGIENRVLVVTGTQSLPCKSPDGDHLMVRLFKNKVDYCRIHGYGIFYNNLLLDSKMGFYWAKLPVIRAAMVAHPETEWLFWVDSDAVFTDMEFEIPLERYKNHNLVVHGWPDLIYKKKSWVAVNTGAFLIRNCQWSMEFLDVWAGMGPKNPNFPNWGKIFKSTPNDNSYTYSDDQSALVYLLLKEKRKWGGKIYIENQYFLHGYWLEIVDKYEEFEAKYLEIEKGVRTLRQRHAEVESGFYAAKREEYLVKDGQRRPFVTHFTGCQPCSGRPDLMYEDGSCRVGMERAINFADNQVLRVYGFGHPDIGNGSSVREVVF